MEKVRKIVCIAAGIAVGCAAAYVIAHRRVIIAMATGKPLPEPPEWHKKWHPCL